MISEDFLEHDKSLTYKSTDISCTNPAEQVSSASENQNSGTLPTTESTVQGETSNPSEPTTFHNKLRWIKGHVHSDIISNPADGVRTRSTTAHECAYAGFLSKIEPKSVKEALNDSDWIQAMQEELDQFEKSKVWDLVPKPKDKSVIGSKWVFRNKSDENGIITRNKASEVMGVKITIKEETLRDVLRLGVDQENTLLDKADVQQTLIEMGYNSNNVSRQKKSNKKLEINALSETVKAVQKQTEDNTAALNKLQESSENRESSSEFKKGLNELQEIKKQMAGVATAGESSSSGRILQEIQFLRANNSSMTEAFEKLLVELTAQRN
ncbi:uncharacterized protein LOC110876427 [Helianthus annuus]|uniref:uncharacterized protein LOC110876427 n=1 Tax=Helianthus annuus TaxID=4232 RepID=UPI000B8F5303|nr:uncharacterized protein LOC110876427 [Helianthus annuus]